VYKISNKEKDKLGEGSFGAVKRVERISTGTKHALKTIKKSSLDSNPMLPKLMQSEL
jgi:calcium-dependent protein kinase